MNLTKGKRSDTLEQQQQQAKKSRNANYFCENSLNEI